MKNTILVSAATAFVTTFLVLFTVAMVKGHGCNGACSSGQGGHSGMHGNPHCGGGKSYHGGCHKKKMKKNHCKSSCEEKSCDKNVEVEKEVIIKKTEVIEE